MSGGAAVTGRGRGRGGSPGLHKPAELRGDGAEDWGHAPAAPHRGLALTARGTQSPLWTGGSSVGSNRTRSRQDINAALIAAGASALGTDPPMPLPVRPNWHLPRSTLRQRCPLIRLTPISQMGVRQNPASKSFSVRESTIDESSRLQRRLADGSQRDSPMQVSGAQIRPR